MLQSCDIICPSKQMEHRHSWSAQVSRKEMTFSHSVALQRSGSSSRIFSHGSPTAFFMLVFVTARLLQKESMVSSKKGNSYPSCLKVPLLVVTVLLSKGFFYFTAVAVYSPTTHFVGSMKFVPLGYIHLSEKCVICANNMHQILDPQSGCCKLKLLGKKLA